MLYLARNRTQGFTLIEIIVAVAIFAVVTALAFPALAQFLEMRERVLDQQEQITSLQKTFLFLGNDLRYAANRTGKDEYGDVGDSTLVVNDEAILELTTSYPDINYDGLSVPRRVRWELNDNKLQRKQYPVMDPLTDTRVMTQTLLENIEEMEVTVHWVEDGRSAEDDQWQETTHLPDMVVVSLRLDNGREYQRQILISSQ